MSGKLEGAVLQQIGPNWNPNGTPTIEGKGRLNSIVFATVLILLGAGLMTIIPFWETDSPLLNTSGKKLALEGLLGFLVIALFFSNARFAHSVWSERPPTRGH